eukprot:scaffold1183_cov418-Prasinococcus_capsulatus_cf.AAC.37
MSEGEPDRWRSRPVELPRVASKRVRLASTQFSSMASGDCSRRVRPGRPPARASLQDEGQSGHASLGNETGHAESGSISVHAREAADGPASRSNARARPQVEPRALHHLPHSTM